MPIEEIEEVLKKFNKDEEIIESKLAVRNKTNTSLRLNAENPKRTKLTLEEAKKRNRMILKEMEVVKGNLRSRSVFNPIEMQWKRICENYLNEPSLVVKRWKCDVPIFV